MNLDDLKINKDWTLFLDRDGVINRRQEGGYVTYWDEFEFLPGVLDAIPRLNRVFGILIIVSNQQGVGKGMVSREAVEDIHRRMVQAIDLEGGQIDRIYFSPYLEKENHPWRKPNPGMALQAQKDHPLIDFGRSVMVGDSLTDMEFGRRLGMVNVLIAADPDHLKMPRGLYDFIYPDLVTFSRDVENVIFGGR